MCADKDIDKELTNLAKEFIDENGREVEFVKVVMLGAIENPNMLKGFLIAWKICSLQVKEQEADELNRILNLK